MHAARERCTGTNLAAVLDDTVVIDRASCIKNTVSANAGIDVDDCSSVDDGSFTDFGARRYGG
jgi:hypothetical protein